MKAISSRRLAVLLGGLLLAGCSGPAVRAPVSAARAAPPSPLEVPALALAPAGDYAIGPRDLLALGVFELEKPGETAALELEVSSEGRVGLPFLGTVLVAGKTVSALRQEIADALGARYLVDPQVILSVKEYRSRRVSVMGAVAKPGVFFLNRNRTTLVEALSLAGGLAKEAGTRAIVLLAPPAGAVGPAKRVEVDLVPLLLRADRQRDLVLEPESVVEVPQAEEFFVSGYVSKPGPFAYQRPTTVLQAVAMAGGLTERGSPSAVLLKRSTGTRLEVIPVDLDAIAEGRARDVDVRPGDSVEAGRTTAWAVYTEFMDIVKRFVNVGVSAGAF